MRSWEVVRAYVPGAMPGAYLQRGVLQQELQRITGQRQPAAPQLLVAATGGSRRSLCEA